MRAANIEEVITILDGIIAEQRELRSPLAFFPALYRGVTLRIRAGILDGTFADGDRMNRFDTTFANRYFAAFDAFRSGATPSRAWQVCFCVEKRRAGTMILQHLLLGMNAHINFDLPIAAVEI